MMDEQAAFLAAIRAEPDDDLPRLVYADWLDEHGEHERALSLRLMVRDGSSGPWSMHDFAALFAHPKPHPTRAARVRRGFAEEVQLLWRDWFRHGRTVLASPCAVVRRVTLTGWPVLEVRTGGLAVRVARQEGRPLLVEEPFPAGPVDYDVTRRRLFAAAAAAMPGAWPGHCPNHPIAWEFPDIGPGEWAEQA